MKEFFVKIWGAVVSFFKNEKDSIIKPTVVLLCICIIIPLALAVTNKVTEDRIKVLEEKNAKQTMSSLVKAEKFVSKDGNGFAYHEAVNKKGEVVAYIFKTSAKGYGGDVVVMTAFSPTGSISNLAVLDVSNETPGLGQNAAKPAFYEQFKDISDKISINDVDTVTSATITSKAVTNAINDAISNFNSLASKPVTLPETTTDNAIETEAATDEK